jgi:hypothetical protein
VAVAVGVGVGVGEAVGELVVNGATLEVVGGGVVETGGTVTDAGGTVVDTGGAVVVAGAEGVDEQPVNPLITASKAASPRIRLKYSRDFISSSDFLN